MNNKPISIAYFSLEYGINDNIKLYAGGLGILAGDTLKTAANKKLDYCGVGILYKKGYFKQVINDAGEQETLEDIWDYEKFLTLKLTPKEYQIGGYKIWLQVWEYQVKSINGSIPLYLIDCDLPQNSEFFKSISYHLYPNEYLLKHRQELVLGIGGVKILEEIRGSLTDIIHINESHAGFCIVELLKRFSNDEVKQKLVFTTHTPVPAGHEVFTKYQIKEYLGEDLTLLDDQFKTGEHLKMTEMCYFYSKFSNGVSKKHSQVASKMFEGFEFDFITNGIDVNTWINPKMAELFDKNIDNWRLVPQNLRLAQTISHVDFAQTKKAIKVAYFNKLNSQINSKLDPEIFTICFARRAANYKRMNLLFRDFERLEKIASKFTKLQVLFSGKAHPNDELGQKYIQEIISFTKKKSPHVEICFLTDYNMDTSADLVSGVDIWLNNPIVPLEASGTSGMKAALNGVPSFSTVDGWWPEGLVEGVTGWSIGTGKEGEEFLEEEAENLYSKLEHVILPIYYNDSKNWIDIQKSSIAINGSYFNTSRMLDEYILKAYNK